MLGADFLFLVFKHLYTTGAFARLAGGVGINHLGADKFSRMAIPLPPHAEQRRIVVEAERRLSALAHVERQVKVALEETNSLRHVLINHALSGKLVRQIRSNEPATKLLSRIRELKNRLANRPKSKRRETDRLRPERRPMLSLKEIESTHLANIVRHHNGPLSAKALWKESGLTIDDFYAQLKRELGQTLEERGDDRLLEVKR